MQNVNNGIEQVMFWQHCNEAEVQAYAEFARRLVLHRLGFGKVCTIMVLFLSVSSSTMPFTE